MEKYITVTYLNKPKTSYPLKLIKKLFKSGSKGLLEGYLFPEYSHVLDLGSGRGDYLEAFCYHGFEIEGFDRCIPESPLDTTYNTTLGDLEQPLPYKNNSFDIIFCKSVIEHLYYPEKTFKEVYRILKEGGAFVVMTPDYDSTKQVFNNDFTHRSPFTLKSLEQIYKIHNFRNVTCIKMRQLPILWKHSYMLPICKIAELFYNPNTKDIFIKFSKEKMLLSIGIK